MGSTGWQETAVCQNRRTVILNHPNLTATIYDKRGRILSVGKNSYVKTHPRQARLARLLEQPDRVFLHAEIAAIARCKRLEKAYRIRVERYGARGEPRLAKPCSICQKAITLAGIQITEYTE